VHTADTGADLRISGGLAAELTWNEIANVSGALDAELSMRYRPLERPQGHLTASVGGNVSVCLVCAFGVELGQVVLVDGDLYGPRTFLTWGGIPRGCGRLANTRWSGTADFDDEGIPSVQISVAFNEEGLIRSLWSSDQGELLEFVHQIEETCDTVSVELQLPGIDYGGHWSGGFDAAGTSLSGSFSHSYQGEGYSGDWDLRRLDD
jgi:hypothetical protein